MSEQEYDPDVPVPLDMDSVEAVGDEFIKFDMTWTPPVYKWLLTTLLPNDCRVHAVFDTREQAVGYADEVMDIEPHLWYKDASEELRCHNSEGYHYYITREIYHALSPGDDNGH